MDDRLKQRLVGAVVLVVAAVVFVPMLFDSRDGVSVSHGHTVVSPLPPPSAAEPEDATARVFPLEDNATAGVDADGARTSAAPAGASPAATRPAAATSAASASASSGSTAKPPAGKSGFAVQLGSFSKAANAQGLRDRLVAKGYTAYTVTKDSVTRVFVGPQPSRAEAERMREKLLADTKLEGIVVEHSG